MNDADPIDYQGFFECHGLHLLQLVLHLSSKYYAKLFKSFNLK